MPKVYLIDDSAPNAFATGRDPEHASVAITTRPARASSIARSCKASSPTKWPTSATYDIRLMLLLAVLIGIIVMLSDFFWQMLALLGAAARAARSDSKERQRRQPAHG